MIKLNPAIHGHILSLLLLFLFNSAFSQTSSSSTQLTTFQTLEANIQHNKELRQTAQRLEQLKAQAITTKDDISQARSLYDLLQIRDKQTEDSLYFQNSAFMDTLIASRNSSGTLKALMYLLRAQRIAGFDQRYRRFNTGAYKSDRLKVNYAALSADQRAELVRNDFEAAFKLESVKAPFETLSWLPSDPEALAFNADFEDVLRSTQIAWLKQRYTGDNMMRLRSNSWLQLSSTKFRNKLDSLASRANTEHLNALNAYRDWIHAKQHNLEKSSFIEALARQHIYQSGYPDSAQRQSYIIYLQNNSQSSLQSIKLHALYQLCLIWNDEGNEYPGTVRMQFHRKKALDLYEEHAEAFKRYPVYDQPLADMVKQIRAAGVQIVLEDKVQPNQQIPILVNYRNSDSLFYRIIRMSGKVQNDNSLTVHNVWLQQKPVAEGKFVLDLPEDYQLHTAKLNLPALPIGWYRLIFRNKTLGEVGGDLNTLVFHVTSIAAIHDDTKLFVLNRSTGVPLSGARVHLLQKKQAGKKSDVFEVASDGHVDLRSQPGDSLRISYQGDTLLYHRANYGIKQLRSAFNEDEFDDLNEFYTKNLRMEVFTDRSIYRPGQTVHYKVIFLTKHEQTGKSILLNKENLGSAQFKRWMETLVKDGSNKIKMTDPFVKVADSSTITINDFASFAGSFVLPKTAAVGAWTIGDRERYNSTNAGRFQVEEYKRPSIEISMEKQKKMLLPGQAFQVGLNVRTFSGATLNNIPVTYSVTRNFYHPYHSSRGKLYKDVPAVLELADTTVYTDEKGTFQFSIRDTALQKLKTDDEQSFEINYSIVAKAVDPTGETAELAETIYLSSRPVNIEVDVADTYDRQVLPIFAVKTSNSFEGSIKRNVHVQLFQLGNTSMDTSGTRTMVLDTMVQSGFGGKVLLSKEKVSTGYYQLLLSTKENDKTLGKAEFNFSVFDSRSTDIPAGDVDYIAVKTARAGDVITWYSSGQKDNYTIYQTLYTNGKDGQKLQSSYKTRMEKPGLRSWSFRVPKGIKGQLLLQRVTVIDNKIQKYEKPIIIESDEVLEAPELVVEKYRRVLAPGATETVKLSLKTKNANLAAELLTTIYDATLDKLNRHQWRMPNTDAPLVYFGSSWSYAITNSQQKGDAAADVRWINVRRYSAASTGDLLAKRVMGMGMSDNQPLNEVVVGYGMSRQEIRIRGNTTLSKGKQALVIVDGNVFAGNINSLDQALIKDMSVLKDAEAVAIYGSAAAQGAIVISTSGKIMLPGMEVVPVKIRKDFSETAFFQPQIHVDREGYFNFSYTMPESATTWNWKMLAHTTKGKFAYLEKTIQTQLSLMLQANMPRFLYQGDQLSLQSRISNLDTLDLSGNAKLKIEDAVTGEDLTALMTAQNIRSFSLKRKSSTAVSYALHIPEAQINPLRVIITASSGSSADAEEHVLPVLSTRVFLRQRQQLQFDSKEPVTVKPPVLPADAALQGMSISIDQKPSATLLYALPWLANNRFEGAEQVFDKLRAQVMAMTLLQQDTSLQAAFKKSGAMSIKETAAADLLPKEISADLMPWLGLSHHVATQQRQLRELLDHANATQQVSKQLTKLYKLQDAKGALAWFDGGRPNADVSAYVLAGFGQLQQHSVFKDLSGDQQFSAFLQKLVANHAQLLTPERADVPTLYQLHALSYWLEAYPLIASQQNEVIELLKKNWLAAPQLSLEQQALLIINTVRYSCPTPLLEKAYRQLEDIRQLAIEDQQHGLRWKTIADGEGMDRSAEETMALLAEAFETSGKYKGLDAKLLKWLLTTKEGEHWQTTAGTAAAIALLQKQKPDFTGTAKSFTTSIGTKKLLVSDDLLSGKPMDYMAINSVPQRIEMETTNSEASGDFTWYYFADPSQLDTLNKGLKIRKTLYVFQKEQGWVSITSSNALNAGDRVQVRLKVESATNLKFVHIKDTRAAAFEPQQVKSGHQYTGGTSYYQAVRDTGMDIFAELLPRGITEFKYEVVVAHAGTFHSGPATVQSMYKPALTAYSGVSSITTN
jgi:TonB-dependent SusC/RagA subfamily outer membrane receptor